ncbi:AAA family ATPase [Microvirga mediterraneensis]|uniref:AAA family ATPase n=1 Tax=Microvirga mediterraneensis TaxID=2754695 RepID=A0A838BVV4_9HYPH|nr:AAA family ATPase [Microvirga mediterraneensis]MBA1159232.1 AAA family ATPase [Microvirga mediterraneensis]
MSKRETSKSRTASVYRGMQSRIAALKARPSSDDVSLDELQATQEVSPSPYPRLVELALDPTLRPYEARRAVAGEIARGVPALAQAAEDWARGQEDGETLAQLLDERSIERNAPGLARLAEDVSFLTLATSTDRTPYAGSIVGRLARLVDALDGDAVTPELFQRARLLVLCWRAWLGGEGQTSSFFPAHQIVHDLLVRFDTRSQADDTGVHGTQETDLSVGSPEAAGETLLEHAGPGLVILPRLPLATSREARNALTPFEAIAGKSLALLPTPDLAAVRQRLVPRFPHLTGVIDQILTNIVPGDTLRFQSPMLLLGSPGIAKTTLAMALCRELGLPHRVIDGASTFDGMLLGASRQWSAASPGCHWDLILEHRVANPALIIDEVEKVGGSKRNGDLKSTLLALLEPQRAASFLDPYLEMPIDLSALNVILTANDLSPLSRPLLDRLTIIWIPSPGPNHLDALASSLARDLCQARGLDERWYVPLTGAEMDLLRAHWTGGSIRVLRRLVQVVLNARDTSAFRH